jgi:excisionase family DNA binding protein
MARTKSTKKLTPAPAVAAAATQPATVNGAATDEVLTLAEAAAYLRLPEDTVVQLVWSEGLSGRHVGKEWRFLKSALQDWLRTPPKKGTKEALLAMAGKFKDDPFLDEICREAYRQRKLNVIEDDE